MTSTISSAETTAKPRCRLWILPLPPSQILAEDRLAISELWLYRENETQPSGAAVRTFCGLVYHGDASQGGFDVFIVSRGRCKNVRTIQAAKKFFAKHVESLGWEVVR